jgi:small subunit ribosomal protein S21
MPLRMRVHDREPIGLALRRFKKLLERSGLTKELRKRRHYEKPCEIRRRATLRKQSAIRKGKLEARNGTYRSGA